MERLFDLTLWLAGAGHFLLPIAGLQLPYRFEWKKDLASLKAMNRKLLWIYWIFITFCVFSFGILTLVFHDAFLRGDRVALALSLFIGSFWLLRVLMDIFYLDHKDWPPGKRFWVAHGLIMILDSFLVVTYFGLILWHGYKN